MSTHLSLVDKSSTTTFVMDDTDLFMTCIVVMCASRFATEINSLSVLVLIRRRFCLKLLAQLLTVCFLLLSALAGKVKQPVASVCR